MSIATIEVTTHIGQAVYEEMIEAKYLAEKERRELVGWSMSGHAYLSLICHLLEDRQGIEADFSNAKFLGLPISLHQSAQPFAPLFSPREAGRIEYEARKL